jgi:hypothetical protein
MGFLNKMFSKRQIDSRLIGKWIVDTDEFQGTMMTFKDNGELIYEIIEKEKTSIINLTFETKGDSIITNQPSHPQVEKTRYTVSDEFLIMDYQGVISKYKKMI